MAGCDGYEHVLDRAEDGWLAYRIGSSGIPTNDWKRYAKQQESIIQNRNRSSSILGSEPNDDEVDFNEDDDDMEFSSEEEEEEVEKK